MTIYIDCCAMCPKALSEPSSTLTVSVLLKKKVLGSVAKPKILLALHVIFR